MTAVGDGEVVRLRPLSVVDDGGGSVIGDPATGVFVSVPRVGGLVVRALLDGASVAEASAAAERFAGQPVNVGAFLERLAGLGLAADGAQAPRRPRPTAALQQRGWLSGPAPERVRWLFGRPAWAGYTALFLLGIACLIARPGLLPQPRDAYLLLHAGVGPSLVMLFPVATALTAVHECWHWLAARAAGLQARFGIDRRLYFVVFETDLSQLWALPRRRRYGPMLAGLAADSTMLAVLLAFRLGAAELWWRPPAFAVHLAAALAFLEMSSMAWQCLLFMRTDLYAVLVTGTGCHNLWRVKTLLLRRALRILSPEQAAELATAGRRDLAVAAWFRWLWLAGLIAAAGWFAWFYLPLLAHLTVWIGPGLKDSPATSRFWLTLGCAAILAWRFGTPAMLALRSAAHRSRRGSGQPSR